MTGATRSRLLVAVAAGAVLGALLAVLTVLLGLGRTLTSPAVVLGSAAGVPALAVLAVLTITAGTTGTPGSAAPLPPRATLVTDGPPPVRPTRPVQPEPASPPRTRRVHLPLSASVDGRPAVRQVVQCPRCADFVLEVRELHPGFAFGCRACGHRWSWAPGQPWPVTVVRPALSVADIVPPPERPSWRLNA